MGPIFVTLPLVGTHAFSSPFYHLSSFYIKSLVEKFPKQYIDYICMSLGVDLICSQTTAHKQNGGRVGFHVMYCSGRAPGHSGGMLCLQSATIQVTFAVGRKNNTLTLHNAFEAHFSGTCVCYMVAVLRRFSLFFPAIFFAFFFFVYNHYY